MKLSKGYWQTYKETPSDAVIPSHKLMLRAGMILKSASGLYSTLPMLMRVQKKIEQIVRDEHDKISFSEMSMSLITPSDLWKESGRWGIFGGEMLKVKDRGDRDLCFSPTNEESIVDIFRKTVNSYKQLPVTLYQINKKFRDEIRPRYGVIRSREFLMKDAYSFHENKECLDNVYEDVFNVYTRIINRIGLRFIAVEADGGAMADGNSKTHEFQVLAKSGEDQIIYCKKCEYAANIEKASAIPLQLNNDKAEASYEIVDTPNSGTIESVCNFLGLEQYKSLKSVCYSAVYGEEEKFILALVIGNDSISENKLKAHLKCDHLQQLPDSTMLELNIPKGYIGPFKIDGKLDILMDSSINLNAPFCVGGMKESTHAVNFVPSRDADKFTVVDIRMAVAGDSCTICDHEVEEMKGVEVGHIFQLGDKYTKSMQSSILDRNGKKLFPLMGSYGIGISRMVAAAIEQSHDENGIIWPISIAPYHVYFATITKSEEYADLANEIYSELQQSGIEVLMDDRKAGAGFKFKDSDLLGLPIRIVLGERDYKNSQCFEVKMRKTGEVFKVTREELLTFVNKKIEELNKELEE